MTLKEFYAAVGGDYDATLNRIPKESMVLRFVKKYADDKTYAQLTEAVKAQDWETAFRASHTLKGVAQNLGFDGLYRAAFALTEEMRGGQAADGHCPLRCRDAAATDCDRRRAAAGIRTKNMREQKWNLGRFIGRSSALLLLFALLFLPSARAEEGENLPKIIIGSDEYQPYSYYNVDGSPQGVDVEMAREAFRRMGYAPVFRHVAWEDKDEALEDGTVDCLWSGFMMNNCEDKYTWARLNLFSRLVAVVRADSAYADLADLAGCRAAVQATSWAEYLLIRQDQPGIPKVKTVYSFSSMEEVFAVMRKGYADTIVGHECVLNIFLAENEGRYRKLETLLGTAELGVAFQKGTHEELARQLEQTLAEMAADGTMAEILTAYGINGTVRMGGIESK